ncbi:MAG: aminotransferase class V-fold PLP-dependent enzyme [Candidatus Heimdallarchaeota archaeon]
MNIDEIRHDFPLLNKIIYLNNAATSILPTPTRRAIEDYMERRAYMYPFDFEQFFSEVWDRPISQLLNAEPEETLCVHSTAEGLNRIYNGLNWNQSDNVVTCDLEYPAVVIPLFQLQQKVNFEIRMATNHNGQYPIDTIVNLIDDNTRAVVLSHVEWIGGWRHDLEQIAKTAKDYNALVIVDPIQSLGAFEFDVKRMGIDALSAQGLKWLLAPFGIGVMYIRSEIVEELSPVYTGVGSLANQKEFWDIIQKEVSLMDAIKTWPIRTDIHKFQLGLPTCLAIVGLSRSIDYLLNLGLQNIEKRVLDLSEFLTRLLTEHEYKIFGPTDRIHQSGIVCFRTKVKDPTEVCKRLVEQKIYISARGGMLRVSPHVYNTEDEITHCMDAIMALDKA